MASKKILGFSLGGLVVLAVLVVGAVLGWRKMQARRHERAVEIVPGK